MIISGNALARLITCSGKNHTERENYFFLQCMPIKSRDDMQGQIKS